MEEAHNNNRLATNEHASSNTRQHRKQRLKERKRKAEEWFARKVPVLKERLATELHQHELFLSLVVPPSVSRAFFPSASSSPHYPPPPSPSSSSSHSFLRPSFLRRGRGRRSGRGGGEEERDPEGEEEMIAKGCLLFTNAFRESRGLPALQWSSQLAVIALAHSIDMGEGRVPMGHDGFQERMAQTPFRWRSFAENVAMMSNPHSFSLFHNDVDDIAQGLWKVGRDHQDIAGIFFRTAASVA